MSKHGWTKAFRDGLQTKLPLRAKECQRYTQFRTDYC